MHQLFLPLAGILGLWLGFPNPLIQLPLLSLLYPAALYARGIQAPDLKTALRDGWLIGLLASSGCLYWLAVPVHDFGGLPWLLAGPCAVAIGGYVGLYSGLFCAGMRLARDRSTPFRRALFAGVLWFLIEWLRGWILTGFPWLSLSTAFVPWPVVIQGASIIGAYGLSGVLAAMSCLAYEALHGRQLVSCSVVLGLMLLSVCGWGVHTISSPIKGESPFGAAFIQGNINQDQKWEQAFQQSTVDKYMELSAKALASGSPRLLIWPETAMPFFFQEHKKYGPLVRDFARENNVAILLGTPGYINSRTSKKYDLYNRAYLVGPDGSDYGFYDKEHLVPFGEYLPPGLDLPFLAKLLQGVGDFTPGKEIKPLTLGNLALGMLICYESIFPELAWQRVADGANVLVNISNDAWFGLTAAPEQHLQLSAMRAVEQGRFLLRGTNTGISAVIDPHGRIINRSPLFSSEVIAIDAVPLDARTPFHHAMPWLPWVAVLIGLSLIIKRPTTKL